MVCPVTNDAPGEASQRTADATSSTWPTRPMGWSDAAYFFASSLAKARLYISVSIAAGGAAFAPRASFGFSSAAALVRAKTDGFLAAQGPKSAPPSRPTADVGVEMPPA